MLNNQQVKLIQTAVRAAGIRLPKDDRRYRLLLRQYKQPNGSPVISCKQLTNTQLEDLLAICEANGWRMPGKPDNYFRFKRATESEYASFAQQEAIKHLAGDLGWSAIQLEGMLKRMTGGFATNINSLTPGQAYNIIEALKAMLGRERGVNYSNLNEVQEDMEAARDGQKQTSQVE